MIGAECDGAVRVDITIAISCTRNTMRLYVDVFVVAFLIVLPLLRHVISSLHKPTQYTLPQHRNFVDSSTLTSEGKRLLLRCMIYRGLGVGICVMPGSAKTLAEIGAADILLAGRSFAVVVVLVVVH